LPFADAMRFKPMEFSTPDSSTQKPHHDFSFQLSSSPFSIALAKKREDSDTGSSCNRLNVSNVSNNLKMHTSILLQALLNIPSQPNAQAHRERPQRAFSG
jgi:hypothetical protein